MPVEEKTIVGTPPEETEEEESLPLCPYFTGKFCQPDCSAFVEEADGSADCLRVILLESAIELIAVTKQILLGLVEKYQIPLAELKEETEEETEEETGGEDG